MKRKTSAIMTATPAMVPLFVELDALGEGVGVDVV